MLKVIKQSFVSYTVENSKEIVVGWIRKSDNGLYTVHLKNSITGEFVQDNFVGNYKEAKEYALIWAEGGTFDINS
jgi:hypothetical protein